VQKKQVVSQVIGMANNGVLAEQTAKGTLDKIPDIGLLIPVHKKDYIAPIEVEKIQLNKSVAKTKTSSKESIKTKIEKQK